MNHNPKFAILRYLPNVISDVSVAFGILGHEVGTGTFADVKFLDAWEPILRVDPTADIEALSSLVLVNPQGCGLRFGRPLEIGTPVRLEGLPAKRSVTAQVVNCIWREVLARWRACCHLPGAPNWM